MRTTLFSGILIVLCATGFVAAQEPKGVFGPYHLPGDGVLAPISKMGFLPNTTGGVDALDLVSGKLLWSTKEGNRPLVASEDRVFVQKSEKGKPNQVRLVLLASKDEGRRVFESKPIVLPDWVAVEVAYGRSFRSNIRLNNEHLWFTWEARAFYAGGARPTPEIEKAARKEASGVMRVELNFGTVEALDAKAIAAAKFLATPESALVTKVGTLTLAVKDIPGANPANPFTRRRMLQASNDAKEIVWEREIAAPVFLIPRP